MNKEIELTEQQAKALACLKEKQTGRFFTGISPTVTKNDFVELNRRLNTNPEEKEKLRKTEEALFALCSFTP